MQIGHGYVGQQVHNGWHSSSYLGKRNRAPFSGVNGRTVPIYDVDTVFVRPDIAYF